MISRKNELRADLDRSGYELVGAHYTREGRFGTFNTYVIASGRRATQRQRTWSTVASATSRVSTHGLYARRRSSWMREPEPRNPIRLFTILRLLFSVLLTLFSFRA